MEITTRKSKARSLLPTSLFALLNNHHNRTFRIMTAWTLLILLFSVMAMKANSKAESSPHSKQMIIPHDDTTSTQIKSQNQPRIYLIPGNDVACEHRFNYMCRFWFHVRCMLFRRLKNMIVVPNSLGGLKKAVQISQKGDIIMLVYRFGHNHSVIPSELQYALSMKSQGMYNMEGVRVGVFHVAPELERDFWPWYKLPDFVIRTYWISDHLPSHIMSVPIGPQYPDSCTPSFIQDSIPHNLSTLSAQEEAANPSCTCGAKRILRSSQRNHMWSFSGSLRRGRHYLVKMLRADESLKDRGVIHVATGFGGDGQIGSRNQTANPKTRHLDLIEQSMFVFAPCGNVMETHRIYEAVSLGAIPIIENCEPHLSHFFPFRDLVVDGQMSEMIKFVASFLDKQEEIDRLQLKMLNWWESYSNELAKNVSRVVFNHVPASEKLSIP